MRRSPLSEGLTWIKAVALSRLRDRADLALSAVKLEKPARGPTGVRRARECGG